MESQDIVDSAQDDGVDYAPREDGSSYSECNVLQLVHDESVEDISMPRPSWLATSEAVGTRAHRPP